MNNTSPFIQSIQINKVRHLENVHISLDDSRPRHLILTGPNGSGKTSVIQVLRGYLEGVRNKNILQVANWMETAPNFENLIQNLHEDLSKANSDEQKARIHGQIAQFRAAKEQMNANIFQFSNIALVINNLPHLVDLYHQGKFLLSCFEAKRASSMQSVNGAQRLDLRPVSPIGIGPGSVGASFLQFLVNQKNRAALLSMKGDQAGVAEIENWMATITQKFRELFQNEELRLEYDIDNFDFTVHLPGRDPFRLIGGELSDGFSAVLHIVAELLMRMEAAGPGKSDYKIPGIVLIDEIETHLHIKLQKAILPFLTAFFPNIQFIVTTHSPFVLTSLQDAVIFDLESQRRWENIMPLSASTVVEEYFDLDLYSEEIKRLMARLAELVRVTQRCEQEELEFQRICAQLDGIDFERAPELVAEYHALRAREASR